MSDASTTSSRAMSSSTPTASPRTRTTERANFDLYGSGITFNDLFDELPAAFGASTPAREAGAALDNDAAGHTLHSAHPVTAALSPDIASFLYNRNAQSLFQPVGGAVG